MDYWKPNKTKQVRNAIHYMIAISSWFMWFYTINSSSQSDCQCRVLLQDYEISERKSFFLSQLYDSSCWRHFIVAIPHPYSPDLASFDFFLFPKPKFKLKGHCFDPVKDIQYESHMVLDTLKSRTSRELHWHQHFTKRDNQFRE